MKNKSVKPFLFLVVFMLFGINSGEANGQTKCKGAFNNADLAESSKRDFEDYSPIRADTDGDGKLDTITPRTYKLKAKGKYKETHWITFDLKTAKGKILKSFFKYQYGTNLSDYWVYRLVPCQINSGKGRDLIFNAGDDTSSETIILENKGSYFKAHSAQN